MKVSVIMRRGACGRHVARCPTLPGCVVNADTAENAAQKMRLAVRSYLCSLDVSSPMTIDMLVSVEASTMPSQELHRCT